MSAKFKKYKDFLYYLYKPNSKKSWYEFYIEKDAPNEVVYPFDSFLSFCFDWSMRRTKEEAEQKAKSLIKKYYTNPVVTELFDRERE